MRRRGRSYPRLSAMSSRGLRSTPTNGAATQACTSSATRIAWSVTATTRARAIGPPDEILYREEEAVAELERAGFEVDSRAGFKYHFVLLGRPG